MDNTHIIKVTAVTEVFGEGQKTIAAAVEYDANIAPDSIGPEKYSVEDRTITEVYVSDEPCGAAKDTGNFVILKLNRDDREAGTLIKKPRTDGRPGGITNLITPRPIVSQVGIIKTAEGEEYAPEAPVTGSAVIDPVVDKFKVFTYQLADGRKVDYNLYIPENIEPGREYPLVYFIVDAGNLSQDMRVTLCQGLGATVWARPEEQRKHPCFVLAPQFHGPESLVQDDFSCTWEVDAALQLVLHIMDIYPIDKKRVYGTGQSMGCMTTCELNMRRPDLYGASLLVGGQWDPVGMTAAKANNFWICVSSGDRKAFPGMNAITEAFEKTGETVGRAVLDATDMPEMNRIVSDLAQDGNHIHYTWFKDDTVIPDGVEPNGGNHHINSWRVAYDIEALRDWLFTQHRD
ncbi:MAG: hypothetical protein ACI3VB_02580 [Oscillospiraceae bacterium]